MFRYLVNFIIPVFLLIRLKAAENFPPPEFSGNYQYPREFWPMSRAAIFSIIDVLVLLLALITAAILVHKKRSPRDLFLLSLFAIAYFGFYRHGCICPVGSIQNVALSLGNFNYQLPLTVGLFFLLPLLFALFCGRVFCSSVCPFGALQEIILWHRWKISRPVAEALGILPYLVLGVAIFSAITGGIFYVCKFDPFVPLFRLDAPLFMLVTAGIVLLLSIFIGRPYCRFFCPYGVLLRWLAPLARWRMKITRTSCIECHLCAEGCPYDAILPPTVKTKSNEKVTLLLVLLIFPLLVFLGAWGGYQARGYFQRLHPTIIHAEKNWQIEKLEMQGGKIDPSSPNRALYLRAIKVKKMLGYAAIFLGGWCGMVIGGKAILLSIRRQRSEYSIDQAACYSCGRCYSFCPTEEASERLSVNLEVVDKDD